MNLDYGSYLKMPIYMRKYLVERTIALNNPKE